MRSRDNIWHDAKSIPPVVEGTKPLLLLQLEVLLDIRDYLDKFEDVANMIKDMYAAPPTPAVRV